MIHTSFTQRFAYHAPDKEKIAQHTVVRSACLECAKLIDSVTPEGREHALAITHLENAMFWANAAIARNVAPPQEEE